MVNIVEARRRLSGMETSDLLSMPHNDLLEGAIVLEEFSKVCAYKLVQSSNTVTVVHGGLSVSSTLYMYTFILERRMFGDLSDSS